MPSALRRITEPTIKILSVFVEASSDEHYGSDLSTKTGVKGTTVYSILDRLEDLGWLSARWEQAVLGDISRPPRRYYRLSKFGMRLAIRTLADYEYKKESNFALKLFDSSPKFGQSPIRQRNKVETTYIGHESVFAVGQTEFEFVGDGPSTIEFTMGCLSLGKDPISVQKLLINSCDYTDCKNLQSEKVTIDMESGEEYVHRTISIPSEMFETAKGVEIETAIRFVTSKPYIAPVLMYPTDTWEGHLVSAIDNLAVRPVVTHPLTGVEENYVTVRTGGATDGVINVAESISAQKSLKYKDEQISLILHNPKPGLRYGIHTELVDFNPAL